MACSRSFYISSTSDDPYLRMNIGWRLPPDVVRGEYIQLFDVSGNYSTSDLLIPPGMILERPVHLTPEVIYITLLVENNLLVYNAY